jgi:glycosyltransferase involved in cell wall biosynthesis
VIQKEQSSIDRFFTRFALKHASGFVVHASKTVRELEEIFPDKKFSVNESGVRDLKKGDSIPVVKLFHPVYDMFKPDPNFDLEVEKNRLGLKKHVFLFFGFIRKYKGLHYCIEAFNKLASERDDVSLLIVGESFWKTLDETKWINRFKKTLFKTIRGILSKSGDDETEYNPLGLIESLGLKDKVSVVNDFVPNDMTLGGDGARVLLRDKDYFQPATGRMPETLTAQLLEFGSRRPTLLAGAGLPSDNRAEHGSMEPSA